jgi:hypothetical protein
MSFFDSEIVQNELKEINELQKKLMGDVFKYPTMSSEEKENHIEILSTLLEKQKILYTRLSLSDDPKAIEMKERVEESAKLLGFGDADVNQVFNSMKMTIENLKKI